MFQLKGIKLGAKAWSGLLAIAAWLATDAPALHALHNFALQHHWALALGIFCSYIAHLLYQPAVGGGRP